MSVNRNVLIETKTAEAGDTTQYTARGIKATIDKFTATNRDTVARSLTVNLVKAGETVGVSNIVVVAKTLQAGETYTFPEIVGHDLNPGGFISTNASAGNAINIRASGREMS